MAKKQPILHGNLIFTPAQPNIYRERHFISHILINIVRVRQNFHFDAPSYCHRRTDYFFLSFFSIFLDAFLAALTSFLGSKPRRRSRA